MNAAFVFAVAAVAVDTRIPITNEVFIDGRSQGAGSDLDPFMFQCYTEVYNPPQSMGIIEAGSTVKVVGSEIEVILHMRGRCEGYGSFDYRVGKCSAKSTEVETVSEEKTVEHTIQSYEIKMCESSGVSEESWQDLIGTGEVAAASAAGLDDPMAGMTNEECAQHMFASEGSGWHNALSGAGWENCDIAKIARTRPNAQTSAVWSYNGQSTCVCEGVSDLECPDGSVPGRMRQGMPTPGSIANQVTGLTAAKNNGGVHPNCPSLLQK